MVTELQRQADEIAIGRTKTPSAGRQKFLFVDTVRFWSMFAIVAFHSAGVISGSLGQGTARALMMVTCPLKFGTIAFFLISGFLLGERFETGDAREFLRRRLEKVFLPWSFWFTLQIFYFLSVKFFFHGERLWFNVATLRYLLAETQACLFATSFWFVPNLLLAICVLLIFRKSLRSLKLGAVLLGINLLYVANIYFLWIRSSHTTALFGFVFYLWLGAAASRHYGALSAMVARIPMMALVASASVTCWLAYGEAGLLERMHSPDPVNTLRLSNQVFSVVMVLLLMKLRSRTWPRFVNVSQEMFSVYLAQTFVLYGVASVVKRLLPRMPGLLSLGTDVSFGVLLAVTTGVVFVGCVALSKGLGRVRGLCWIAGRGYVESEGTTGWFAEAMQRIGRRLYERITLDLDEEVEVRVSEASVG